MDGQEKWSLEDGSYYYWKESGNGLGGPTEEKLERSDYVVDMRKFGWKRCGFWWWIPIDLDKTPDDSNGMDCLKMYECHG